MAKPIPDGSNSITPYLYVNGAGRAIDFYKRAFGATDVFRLDGPDGKVGHAELQVGSSRIMLADENPAMGIKGPQTIGGTAVGLLLYVEDVDAVFNRAVKEGATVVRPLADQFYGDRTGGVLDPFGHSWYIATHKEDVSEQEMKSRAAKMMAP
jgi:PhnB protein